ncbi:hypothetical protein NM688_g6857 [Phlebia brevispora]|uniref:Uncharacterized protein n=1 Tax=Phlebia brevispora TaxID=194682 RepID=A0ACC1SBX1_9APHY|nr:hypothetical protein NM688_g6857 [Phlebia brevispora]
MRQSQVEPNPVATVRNAKSATSDEIYPVSPLPKLVAIAMAPASVSAKSVLGSPLGAAFAEAPRSVCLELSTTFFELEIPQEWRFSRIPYPGRGPVRWDEGRPHQEAYQDPMDTENFNEETAFPLVKPNIEVFGLLPPATLRRQRGWYQRNRWRPPKRKGVDRGKKAATGEDVPPELFDIVIGWLVNGRLQNAPRDRVSASKQELGSMALVCRHWAKLIQPMIFRVTMLRGREDVNTLLSFLRSPTTAVSKYLQHPQLSLNIATYPCIPWIHIACSSNMLSKQFILARIDGPLPSGRSMKGLHDMLPRNCPLFFSRIEELLLTDVHFKSLPCILRSVRDMADLKFVRLVKVTWDRPSDDEIHPPLASRRTRFCAHPRYKMQECTDDTAIVWFRSLLQCQGSGRLDQTDADGLYRIVSSLTKHSKYRWLECPEVGFEDVDVGGELRSELHNIPRSLKCTSLPAFFVANGEDGSRPFSVHVTFTQPAEAHARVLHVRTIAIESGNFVQRFFAATPWADIEDLAGRLPALTSFYFLSWWEGACSESDIFYIHNYIVTKRMPKLRAASQVKYAIELEFGSPEKWVWVRVDPPSGDDNRKCTMHGTSPI